MAMFFINGIHMTEREIRLNEARGRGYRAYGYYTPNPYKASDEDGEAMASAWNDGWKQRAEEASGSWW